MKSILLVRLSAIGDIVFASPLVSALRRQWPDAHIAWLVQPECTALLDQHPDLDEVIVCPLRHWQRLWRERRLRELARCIRALRDNLRARDFDLAIDLQGLLKSGALTRLSGARERIGLGSREGSQWLMTRRLPRGGESKRIGSEYLFLAESLGLPVDGFAMVVHYGEPEAAFVEDIIRREALGNGYAVLCPFTTRPQKHWIEAHWSRLARRIGDELGLVPVLLGGPGDGEAAMRIADATDDLVVDLAGKTSLTEAAAMIDRAALLVAVDTGLGHMGIALDTPSLLLFGSTCPYLDTTRPNAQVLYHQLPCSPCKRRPTCGPRATPEQRPWLDCMQRIEVSEVIAAAKQVLKA
ncbi:glycosyltransferase family 9 protein [Thiorhodococcus mannitoliphagus]|uniref:Glycosyltransferase family 9 protein n=1 Tax=Thiorhodococcus mannitoliphagus TaxID=329406 RepID=A0A6P1DUJ8_9GAMM|nr:glycosyltransferase family 9 protein [Thiorhodococcus mannitoliphagus]NEX19374.1 glycosyltransferase family 9 protein [Thiorhodococcus mannitoliphagus]